MKKLILSFSALLLAWNISAQVNKFVVYSMKGNVSIVENNTESKAMIGTMIGSPATIKIAAGSFATIICNEKNMFTLSKSGNYNTANLADSCKGTNSSVSANYMKYIWNELTKSKGSPEKNRKAYMANVGAVSRSINNVWIDPKLDTINYVSGTIPLSWKSYTDAEEFEFQLFSDKNSVSPIYDKTTKKKHVDFADILKQIQPGNTYYWTAMIKGESNEERKYIRYWTKDEYNEYFKSIKNSGASETEAESQFRLGFILEEAHFLAEAYNHYLKATQLSPDNSLYRYTFMSFKKDHEIK